MNQLILKHPKPWTPLYIIILETLRLEHPNSGRTANEGGAANDNGADFEAKDGGTGRPTNDNDHEAYGKLTDSNAKWTTVHVAIEFLFNGSTGSTAGSTVCTTRWYK